MLIFSMSTSFHVCMSKHTLTVSRFNTASMISSSVVSFAFKSQIENNFGTQHLDKRVVDES